MSGSILDEVVIPIFTKGLKTLDHILTKAEEYAKEKGLDANAVFPSARIIEDQFPLTFQVQNATKTVKVTLGRLTGVEYEPFEDKEHTLADLHARIQVALDLLGSIEPGAYKAQEDKILSTQVGPVALKISAKAAALNQGIPNFFFHLTTAYSILRAKGVPVGKGDFIGSFLSGL